MAVALVTAGQPAGIWNGTMIVVALFSEMAFIVYLFPYFVGTDKLMKSLMGATATAVVVILAVLLGCLLLFSSELTANLTYPTLELIRYIHAGVFLENLDPLLIIFWLFSIFLKIFTGVTPVLYYLVDRIRFGKLKKNTNQPETDS
ncbi:GerAB/ArcD/ProY family transporter [Paenibacillus sp. SEL1]